MKIRRDNYDERFSRLSDYLDGSLPADKRSAVEQALADDDELRAELGALRRVDGLVKSSAEAPPELDWAAFMRDARAAREDVAMLRAGLRWRRMLAPLAAAAVLVMAVTAGILWQNVEHENGSAAATRTITMVTLERNVYQAEAPNEPVATLVQVSHAAPTSALMGPPRARRTLLVSVAAHDDDADNGLAEDEAGYF